MSSAPLSTRNLMDVTPRPDAVMVRGEGSWLWDDRGRRYLDFVQGWAVNCLGHASPVIQRALAEQAGRLVSPSPAFHNAPQLDLAEALARASGLDRVFFCSSGAEANEGAIKLARKWGTLHRAGAYEIVTADGSFHGRSLATMAASGRPGFEKLFKPPMPGFEKVPYGDVGAVDRAIGERTVAVMLEPIQGEAGVVVPVPGTLRALRALTRERGVLLIVDEIQTGMGRTGQLFAHAAENVSPDIMTLGKGLGGGVPLAALLASEPASCFAHGDQGGTYCGNPLMTAVGLAVLRTITAPGFLAGVRDRAAQLWRGLCRLARLQGCAGVRGRGLLLALELPAPRGPAIVDACRDRGLLVNSPRPDLLRFMPALDVRAQEIDRMLEILAGVLRRRP